MRKVALFALVISIIYGCGSSDRGELVGVKTKRKWFAEKPLGMVLLPEGSFTMGKQDADLNGTLNTPARTVTVKPFYMDETEITNGEYKRFVFWVRDSIIRTKLAEQADLVSLDDTPNPNNNSRPVWGFKNMLMLMQILQTLLLIKNTCSKII